MLPRLPPSISIARLEITSLAFMFVWVPLPVCHTTRGKWSSSFPSITSSAALIIASPKSSERTPNSTLACAAAFFTMPSALMKSLGNRSCPILKFSNERCVCAPQYLSSATSMLPIESVSTLLPTATTPIYNYLEVF